MTGRWPGRAPNRWRSTLAVAGAAVLLIVTGAAGFGAVAQADPRPAAAANHIAARNPASKAAKTEKTGQRAATADPNNQGILILLDTSGSMADTDVKGTVKIEGAKSGVISLIDALPARTPVGLLTFPGSGDDCAAPITQQEIAPLNTTDFARNVAALPNPTGGTPTALALTTAVDRLKSWGITQATIVLVSDGEANCGADPCDVAKQVVAQGYQLTVNTVGFDISSSGQSELQCIADATQGAYASVEDSAQLGKALAALSKPVLTATVHYPTPLIPVTQQTVKISADVGNSSSLTAHNVRVSLVSNVAGSAQSFAIRTPVKYLGNLDPGSGTTTVSWDVTSDRTSAASTSALTFSVRSDDAAPLDKPVVLRFGQLDPSAIPKDSAFTGRHRVLVLGDSFSSGEGAASPQQPFFSGSGQAQACHRTKNQYAGWIFGSADVTILACSGAETTNLYDTGQNGESPQFTQLDRLLDEGYRPDFVFMSIGGNNVGFPSIVQSCVEGNVAQSWWSNLVAYGAGGPVGPALLSQWRNDCPTDPNNTKKYTKLGETVQSVGGNLPEVYSKVAHEFANKDLTVPPIIVLPYPVLVPLDAQDRGSCTGGPSVQNLALSLHQMDGFLRFQLVLDATIEKAVNDAHGKGIPVYYAADVQWSVQPDHTICSKSQWLNAIGFGKPQVELVHPNVAGHRAMAIALLRWSQTPNLNLHDATIAPDATHPGWFTWFTGLLQTGPQQLQITANPQSGQSVTVQSGQVTVNVTGLQPGSSVTVTIRSTAVPLANGFADASGRFQDVVHLDGSVVPLGDHRIEADVSTADGVNATWSQPITLVEPVPKIAQILLLTGGAAMIFGGAVLVLRLLLPRRGGRRTNTFAGSSN